MTASNPSTPCQLPAAQRFRVGEMTVTALGDGYIEINADALQGVDAAGFDALLSAAHRDPAEPRGSVNAFMIETGGETWMIDAGTGPVFGPTMGHLSEALAATGTDPASVSKLIVSHMHPDHIGGATVDGAPAYPNAELILPSADRDFWTEEAIQAQAPEEFRGMWDLARATIAAYGDRLREFSGEADVATGITARPLPGHTPGHSGFVLESGGDSLLIWTDVIHVPAVQLARPEVTIAFDIDPEQAARTRADIMSELAGTGQRIAGMHMTFPGVGFLDRAGEGFAFVPAPWEYF